MTVIEFCRQVELFAWEHYAFEGAAIICERMIDDGIIDVETMPVAHAAQKIVREAGIPT